MILLLIFIAAFIIQLNETVYDKRKLLALIALAVLLLISWSDLYWLVKHCQFPFHPSDPLNYHIDVKGRMFREVLQIESSNKIYFIINWFLDRVYPDSEIFVSFILKTTNVLVFLITYLLATRNRKHIDIIDYLILFSPYTIMTINRNVRDMYIVLLVLMILMGIGCMKDNKLNLFWTMVGVVFLILFRPILLLPLFVVFLFINRNKISIFNLSILVCIAIVVVALNFQTIITKVAIQTISAIDYIGEDVTEFLPLLQGNITVGVVKTLVIRLAIGFISFLFTPHPINYITLWLSGMDSVGNFGIYTGFDNVLVSLGSLFNYILVIPLLFVMVIKENRPKVNKSIFLFACLFIILYVVSYLGVTDIRNRNTAYFFMLLALMYSDIKPQYTSIGYLATFLVFCVIFIM